MAWTREEAARRAAPTDERLARLDSIGQAKRNRLARLREAVAAHEDSVRRASAADTAASADTLTDREWLDMLLAGPPAATAPGAESMSEREWYDAHYGSTVTPSAERPPRLAGPPSTYGVTYPGPPPEPSRLSGPAFAYRMFLGGLLPDWKGGEPRSLESLAGESSPARQGAGERLIEETLARGTPEQLNAEVLGLNLPATLAATGRVGRELVYWGTLGPFASAVARRVGALPGVARRVVGPFARALRGRAAETLPATVNPATLGTGTATPQAAARLATVAGGAGREALSGAAGAAAFGVGREAVETGGDVPEALRRGAGYAPFGAAVGALVGGAAGARPRPTTATPPPSEPGAAFQTLGLRPGATAEEVQAAYQFRIRWLRDRGLHPEQSAEGAEVLKRLNVARDAALRGAR